MFSISDIRIKYFFGKAEYNESYTFSFFSDNSNYLSRLTLDVAVKLQELPEELPKYLLRKITL